MANYDAQIRVNTKIDNAKFISGAEKVEHSLEEIEERAKNAKERMDALDNAGAPKSSEAYKQAAKDLEKWNTELEKLSINQDKAPADTSGHYNDLRVEVEEYSNALKELESQGQYFGDSEYDKVYLYWKEAVNAVKEYQNELNKQTESGRAAEAAKAASEKEKESAQLQKIEEQQERVRQKEIARIEKEDQIQAKIEAQAAEAQRLKEIKDNAIVSDSNLVALLEEQERIEQRIADLKRAGVTTGYEEYDQLTARLRQIKGTVNDAGKGFGKLAESGKKTLNEINRGVKQSNGLLSKMSNRIKNLAIGALVFNQVRAAFRSMISGMKEGFENLTQYSDEYNAAISGLKSQTAQLKNGLAAAFAPIVNAIIPYLTQFVSWLNTAAMAMSKFLAILGGKSTYTKAKDQVVDYAKSLDSAASSAKKTAGALAGFDDINVLSSQDDSGSGGGGELAGAAAFEEAAIGDSFSGIKKIIDDIISIFNAGFKDGIGDWKTRIEDIKGSLQTIKNAMIGIFTSPEVTASIKGYIEATIYSFGQIAGAVASIGITIAQNLLGGIAQYLEGNSDRIKEFLVRMFDVGADIRKMVGEFVSSFAYVFEAFGSINGQGLTANLIGIVSDAFMGAIELAYQLIHDLLNVIIQPFNDNKERLRTALEGLLGIVGSILGTLKDTIDNTFDKLMEVYDAHIKPFIDSVAEGLSYLLDKFLTFWNDNVQPMLENTGAAFDVLMSSHIQPMIDSFLALIGSLADALKAIWENVLVPLIDWFIDNLLPVILPILEGLWQGVLTCYGYIADIISGLITVIKGVIDFLVGVFTGDWEKAWGGIQDIVNGIMEAIGGLINAAMTTIETVINTILNTIAGIFEVIFSAIGSLVKTIMTTISNIITAMMGGIKTGISNALNAIKTTWNSIWTSLKTSVTNIFTGIWNAIKKVINSILGGIEKMVNGVIDGVNAMIRALNRLHFSIPDWVPGGLGGKSFGFNLSEIGQVSIPKLATGGIVTSSTIANIGEAGREAVLPLENNTGWMDDLADKLASRIPSGSSGPYYLQIDGKTFARLEMPYFNAESGRVGLDFAVT